MGRKNREIAVPYGESESCSVSVRPISNGYIVSQSSYGGKAGYKSTETYSKEKPEIELPAPAPAPKTKPRTRTRLSPLAKASATLSRNR